MRAPAEKILTVADAQRLARQLLPRALYDYIEGGADDELTVSENVYAFRSWRILPRMGIDVREPCIASTVLGAQLEVPVLLAPCGFVQLVHPDGAIGAARAAAAAGTITVLSRIALTEPEQLARQSGGTHWLQVNSAGGRKAVKDLMERAAAASFTGLVVTLDGPPPGNHGRDLRNHVVPPVQITPQSLAVLSAQALARPRWTARMIPVGAGSLRRRASTMASASEVLRASPGGWPRFAWSDVQWIREQWSGVLIVKGLLTESDAIAARDAGADAIIVSNHGGRQLDGVPTPIDALPGIVAAVGGSTEVLLDGGVRRATDVVKALALGANAVLIGRPFVYGLAAAGQPGVERILEIFKTELVRTLKLMGCRGLSELSPTWLQASDVRVLER